MNPEVSRPGGRRDRGAFWSAVLLTLAQPAVWLYAFVAAFASDQCSGTSPQTGICAPTNQLLALAVPVFGCGIAALAAWALVVLRLPRTTRRWGVAACWVLAVACVAYSVWLIGQVPDQRSGV